MNIKIKKIIASFLAIALMCSISSVSVFAGDDIPFPDNPFPAETVLNRQKNSSQSSTEKTIGSITNPQQSIKGEDLTALEIFNIDIGQVKQGQIIEDSLTRRSLNSYQGANSVVVRFDDNGELASVSNFAQQNEKNIITEDDYTNSLSETDYVETIIEYISNQLASNEHYKLVPS